MGQTVGNSDELETLQPWGLWAAVPGLPRCCGHLGPRVPGWGTAAASPISPSSSVPSDKAGRSPGMCPSPSHSVWLSPALSCVPLPDGFNVTMSFAAVHSPIHHKGLVFKAPSQLLTAWTRSTGASRPAPDVPAKIAAATHHSGEEQVSLRIKMTDPSVEVSEGLCFIKQQ